MEYIKVFLLLLFLNISSNINCQEQPNITNSTSPENINHTIIQNETMKTDIPQENIEPPKHEEDKKETLELNIEKNATSQNKQEETNININNEKEENIQNNNTQEEMFLY